ncbi:MAG: flagellar hook-associated protein FlgK [Geminicoccaceae bacterium]
MSLVGTLSTALTGLSAAQRALSVTASNVANVNTEGYTRKVVRQETLIANGEGVGVRAGDTGRIVDDFLNREWQVQRSRLGRSEVLAEAAESIQTALFGTPGGNTGTLADQIGKLSTALEGLANAPESTAQRSNVTAAIEDTLARFAHDADQIQTARRDLDGRIGQVVEEINDRLQSLQGVNAELTRGGASPDLFDRRDRLLDEIAERIDVSVLRRENGTVGVYAAGGQALLDGSAHRLDYAPAASVGPDTVFGPLRLFRADQMDPVSGDPEPGAVGTVLVTSGVRARLTQEQSADAIPDVAQTIRSDLQGGRLQGLIEARDRLLPGLADQLGEAAGLLQHALNAAYSDAAGQSLPTVVAGTRTDTAAFAGAARSGTAYLAVVDRTSRAVLRTVAVDLGAADASALAGQLNADLAGLGSAAIDGTGALSIALADPGQGLAFAAGDGKISLTDTAGRTRDYGFAHFFGLNDLVSGEPPGDLALRTDLAADPSRLDTGRLDVTAGPPPSSRLGGSGDNRGAQALAAALDRQDAIAARGGLPGGRSDIRSYLADMVSTHAVTTSRAKDAATSDGAMVDELSARRAAVSGVNLDDELSRLVLYQQAYAVSARIVTVTGELFDTLLGMGR